MFHLGNKTIILKTVSNVLVEVDPMERLFITGQRHGRLPLFVIFVVVRSTKESDRRLSRDELYLVDSGGQYK